MGGPDGAFTQRARAVVSVSLQQRPAYSAADRPTRGQSQAPSRSPSFRKVLIRGGEARVADNCHDPRMSYLGLDHTVKPSQNANVYPSETKKVSRRIVPLGFTVASVDPSCRGPDRENIEHSDEGALLIHEQQQVSRHSRGDPRCADRLAYFSKYEDCAERGGKACPLNRYGRSINYPNQQQPVVRP